MSFEVSFGGDPEDLLLTTAGTASVDGLDAMVQAALGDSRYRPGMRVLVVHSDLVWPAELSSAELRRRVDLLVRDSERIGRGYVAVVVGQPIAYGFQRMMQAFAGTRISFEPAVFYSVDDARAWLATKRRADRPGA